MDCIEFKNISEEEFYNIATQIIQYIGDYTSRHHQQRPTFRETCQKFDLTYEQLIIICRLTDNLDYNSIGQVEKRDYTLFLPDERFELANEEEEIRVVEDEDKGFTCIRGH